MNDKLLPLLGRRIRGLDGLTPAKFDGRRREELRLVKRKCLGGSYRFTPYVERLLPKGAHKPPRVLSLPTIRDRIVLSSLKECLHQIFPERVLRKLPHDYVRSVKKVVKRPEITHVGRFDIEGFYDNIGHTRLFNLLGNRIATSSLLVLLRRAVRNPTVRRDSRKADRPKRSTRGVPQGLPISNILAEIYIGFLDEALQRRQYRYFRFVDDVLVLGSKAEVRSAAQVIGTELGKVGLKLNEQKSETCISKSRSFDYLGYKFSPTGASVRSSKVDSLVDRLAALITNYRYRIEELLPEKSQWPDRTVLRSALVEELNEKITGALAEGRRYGWVGYYHELDDKRLLYEMDATVRSILRRHAKVLKVNSSEIKSFARAFHEMKHNPAGGYIFNYNTLRSADQKRNYLVKRGYLSLENAKRFSDRRIDRIFEARKLRTLLRLEQDEGMMS